jgi:hypothetical protein
MRLDACVPRKKKDGGTYWVKIGSIWTKDDGGVSMEFDALPLPDESGRVVVKGFVPKEKVQQMMQPGAPQQTGGGFGDMADDIPF